MPERPNSSVKDPTLYEELRAQGDSEEKAARISNAVARDGAKAVGHRGGESGSYEDWTVPQLRRRARELGRHGYSSLPKQRLIALLRDGD
jgi:hypothetical protein